MSDEQQERKQINFTIVPDEQPGEPRIYANFCSIAHTPFDFTLTFCEVMPLSEKEVRDAEQNHVVRAPVKTRLYEGQSVLAHHADDNALDLHVIGVNHDGLHRGIGGL